MIQPKLAFKQKCLHYFQLFTQFAQPFSLIHKALVKNSNYSAGEEKSPLFIFLHDQLPLFLGEIVENFSRFLQEIQYFLQEMPVFLPEILGLYL